MRKLPNEDNRHHNGAPLLVSVEKLAELLEVSARTIRRGVENRKIPPPVRVGSLVTWRLAIINAWIAGGCPSMDDWDMPELQ